MTADPGARAAFIFRKLALVLLLAWSVAAAAESPIALDTGGGEAWTFEKLVEGSIPTGTCDAVALTSPRGTVAAPADGERFIARVPLGSGANVVQVQCLKEGVARGAPAEQRWFVRLRDAPKAQIRAQIIGEGIMLRGASEPAAAAAVAIASYEWHARPGNPAPLPGLPAIGQQITLAVPQPDGEYYITLRLTDALGRVDESTALFRVRNGKPEIVDVAREAPAWLGKALVYGVMPSLFGSRGVEDVTARLDDLANIGVTALWLSPVTASPPGDYGYAVTDYFRLRGNHGSEADFRKLIAAAHARGLRVILDFVPNHLSDQHAYFIDAESRKRASPYFDFFARTPTGDATHYFDWKHLKNLNYDHPEVQRLIIEAFLYWVREFDVDGFRVDVAWGPRERAPDFWPRWRRELKRVKPDLLLLAEASARDPYYLGDGFDVAYDWTEKLGEWAWHEAFENDAHTAQRLRAAIARSLARSGPAAPIFRFLNNNDTGARFITRHGLARTRVAAAVLLTMPGVPGLFTGDEVGAAFEPYRAARPIVWDDSHPLRTWYARLAELRRTHPALRSGELRLLEIEHADQVLGYQRWNREPEQRVVVLLNFGSDPTTVSLPGEALRSITQRSRLVDLVTDEEITAAGAPIPLAGYGVRILEVRR